MTKQITKRQRQTLDLIVAGYLAHRPPSYREMMRALDVTSTNSVYGFISALKRRGYVTRDPGRRLIHPTPKGLALVGCEPGEKVKLIPISLWDDLVKFSEDADGETWDRILDAVEQLRARP